MFSRDEVDVDAPAPDFDAFVRARTPALLRLAYRLTGDQHLAEDLVQSALGLTHRAWRNLHATGNAEAYTRKTMYHLQVSHWRRRRIVESFPGVVPDRPAIQTDHAEQTALRLSLHSALSRLTAKQRAVLVLRFFDDLTEAQAAETLGVSVGTIKSQTAKALERLRVLAPELAGVTVSGEMRRGLSEIAAEVEAVDLRERALATSRQIRVRRTVTAAMAGLAAASLSVAVAVWPDHPPRPPAVEPAPSPTVLPTEQQSGGPDLGPLKSATITVPSWGAAADATCPTGRVTLRDGQYQRDAAHRPVNVLSYVTVDVDHDGAEDYVAHLTCGEGPEAGGRQIVAFRRSGQELELIGRVVGTQDGLAMMDYLEARDGGRIAVLVSKEYSDGGQNTVPNQWRVYAWQNGRFRQVDGPTTFPPHPPTALLSVAPSILSFRPQDNGFTGQMTVTVRNDGIVDVAQLEILLVLPKQVQPAGEDWDGCTVRASSDQTTLVCGVPGPRAQSHTSRRFTFVAADKPVLVDDPVNLGNHYVSVSQAPPFNGRVTVNDPEAVIPITVP